MSIKDIDKVYYYNHNGQLMLTLNEAPYWCGDADLKDWEWSYDTNYGKFNNFYRAKAEYSLVITIASNDTSLRDDLCNIFTADVLAGAPGYLMIRGWKLPCYIVEAEHDFFGTLLDHQIEFKIITETSTWIRETTTSYSGVATGETVDLGRDYSYEDSVLGRGYLARSETTDALMSSDGQTLVDSDGYTLTTGVSTVGVNGYGYSVVSNYSSKISLPTNGNGYRVTFYGAVTNPVIYLDGQPVRVYVTVDAGEQLVVTSNGREKTIYLVSNTGVKTNAFVYRDKEYSPFFSIGKSTELTYGEVKFDFTTIESRSEPAWS